MKFQVLTVARRPVLRGGESISSQERLSCRDIWHLSTRVVNIQLWSFLTIIQATERVNMSTSFFRFTGTMIRSGWSILRWHYVIVTFINYFQKLNWLLNRLTYWQAFKDRYDLVCLIWQRKSGSVWRKAKKLVFTAFGPCPWPVFNPWNA